ncbi:DUF4172 domain-containing protein [Achromobacter anxifer]
MNRGDYVYIWQAPDWPDWRCDLAALAEPLARASLAQGVAIGAPCRCRPWPALMAAPSAFTACRHRFNANGRLTTTSWNALRRVRWM